MQPQRQFHKTHVLRYVVFAFLGAFLLLLLMVGGCYLWLDSDGGHAFLLRRLQAFVARSVNGRVEIGRLSGSLMEGARFENVIVRDASGRALLSAPSVTARYSPRSLISSRAIVDGLSVRAPRIAIVIDPQGRTNVESFFSSPRPRSDEAGLDVLIRRVRAENGTVTISPSSGRPIVFDNVSVDGALRVGHESLARVDRVSARWHLSEKAFDLRGSGRFGWAGGRVSGTDLDLTFGQSHIRAGMSYVSGKPGRFSLEVHSLSLLPTEARKLGIGLNPTGPISARGRLEGPFDRLSVSLHLLPPGGDLDLTGHFAISSQKIALRFNVRTMNLGTVFRELGSVPATGVCELAGRPTSKGFQGTVLVSDASISIQTLRLTNASAQAQWTGQYLELTGYRVDIPGAHVTGTGHATLDGAVDLVFKVHVDDPDDLAENAPLWKTLVLDIATPVVIPLSYVNLIGGELTRAPGEAGHLSLYPLIPGARTIGKPFKEIYKGIKKIWPF